MIIEPSQIKINDRIKFKTYSDRDNVTHIGTVLNICTYPIAKRMADVDNIYQDYKRVMKDSLPDKERLNYFLLQSSPDEADRLFAFEFLDPSTVEMATDNTYLDVRVFDVDTNKEDELLTLLRANGYVVEKL